MGIATLRRHRLLHARQAALTRDKALELTWRAKQRERPGMPLPVNMPARDKLLASGVEALQDLEGATVQELVALPGIGANGAAKILSACEAAMKARGEGSTALLETFPAFDTLEAAGYTTLESLEGHGEKLLERIGLTELEARRVFVRVAFPRLPHDFPSRDALEAASFITKEAILEDASTIEALTAIPGVTEADAASILAAIKP